MKPIEAAGYGKPIVASQVAEGLNSGHGHDVLVHDDDAELAFLPARGFCKMTRWRMRWRRPPIKRRVRSIHSTFFQNGSRTNCEPELLITWWHTACAGGGAPTSSLNAGRFIFPTAPGAPRENHNAPAPGNVEFNTANRL